MAKIVISRSKLEKLLGEAYEAGWLGSKDMKEGAVRQILDVWEDQLNFEQPVERKSPWDGYDHSPDEFRFLPPTLEGLAQAFTVGTFDSADADGT
jgi:hypothetical protein